MLKSKIGFLLYFTRRLIFDTYIIRESGVLLIEKYLQIHRELYII